MSRLQRDLDALPLYRAENPRGCFVTQPQTHSLQVVGPGNRHWFLPWQHFLAGEHAVERGGAEILVLHFATTEVILRGHGLLALGEQAAQYRLASVAAVPAAYARALADEPFVIEIRVQPVAEPASASDRKTPVSS